MLGLTLVASLVGGTVGASSSVPTLILDPGSHLLPVACHTDDRGRYAITGGEDRSVRVWTLPDGRPLGVIQLPQASDTAGRTLRMAVSGDGETLAIGTAQVAPWVQAYAIYILRRSTGEILQTIDGLRVPTIGLALDKQGRHLAVGSGEGVSVYLIGEEPKVVWQDATMRQAWGLEFAGDGRLVASSEERRLIVYSPNGRIEAVDATLTRPSREPKFSPSGRYVAAEGPGDGYSIRAAQTLNILKVCSAEGLTGGQLGVGDWTLDERHFAAGYGARNARGKVVLRIWTNRGFGQSRDVEFDFILKYTRGVKNGFLVTLENDDIYFVTPSGTKRRLVASRRFHFRPPAFPREPSTLAAGPVLVANAQLTRVGIPLAPDGMLEFDLAKRRPRTRILTDEPDPELRTSTLRSLDVLVNPAGQVPLINGIRPPPQTGSPVVSWAVVDRMRELFAGSMWTIALYDRAGNEVWHRPAPHWALQVGTSEDGTLLVSAHMDGTIRWWRRSDGAPLLGLYVDPVSMGWVLWTPSGYYDCSLNAEPWLQWLLNRDGSKNPALYEVGTFRDALYRPDIVDRVLQDGDETASIELANQAQPGAAVDWTPSHLASIAPPAVTSYEARIDTDAARDVLRFRGKCFVPPGVRLRGFDLLIGGVEVGSYATKPNFEDGDEIGADLDLGTVKAWFTTDSHIQVRLRYERDRTSEERTSFSWLFDDRSEPRGGPRWIPQETTETHVSRLNVETRSGPTARPLKKAAGKLYVLAIGVNRPGQAENLTQLSYAEDDAREFASAILTYAPVEFRDSLVKPYVLVGKDATKENIDQAIDEIYRASQDGGGRVFIFFAGHALTDADDRRSYRFPLANFVPDRPRSTSLTGDDLSSIANTLQKLSRVLILDTCYAFEGLRTQKALFDNSYSYGVVAATGTSVAARESSDPSIRHGLLTKALLDAIQVGLKGQPRTTFDDLRFLLKAPFREDGAFFQPDGQYPQVDGVIEDRFVIAERPAFAGPLP